ncbi:MAG TPA: hypothetical protein VLX59_17015, partial [Acidimicrobiales bacterium]|nr:hypothetical protein [Acidimicrobiales bacterium]
AEGSTPLGGALTLLGSRLDQDIVPSGAAHTGDYRPLIFVFTDGDPTDDWRGPARDIRDRMAAKAANIFAVGCGSDVNVALLKELTETVLLMEQANAGSFRKLLDWVSQSVKTASKKRPTGGGSDPSAAIDLPPLPQGLSIVL